MAASLEQITRVSFGEQEIFRVREAMMDCLLVRAMEDAALERRTH